MSVPTSARLDVAGERAHARAKLAAAGRVITAFGRLTPAQREQNGPLVAEHLERLRREVREHEANAEHLEREANVALLTGFELTDEERAKTPPTPAEARRLIAKTARNAESPAIRAVARDLLGAVHRPRVLLRRCAPRAAQRRPGVRRRAHATRAGPDDPGDPEPGPARRRRWAR